MQWLFVGKLKSKNQWVLGGGGGRVYQEIPYPQNKHVMFIVALVILKL
jgi:hypothetical protein